MQKRRILTTLAGLAISAVLQVAAQEKDVKEVDENQMVVDNFQCV